MHSWILTSRETRKRKTSCINGEKSPGLFASSEGSAGPLNGRLLGPVDLNGHIGPRKLSINQFGSQPPSSLISSLSLPRSILKRYLHVCHTTNISLPIISIPYEPSTAMSKPCPSHPQHQPGPPSQSPLRNASSRYSDHGLGVFRCW